MPIKLRWSDSLAPLTRFLLSLVMALTIFDRWGIYTPPLDGLDGSWAIALHLARQSKLIYGTEFIFTYGPLGWYTTRLPIAVQPWELIGLDIVYVTHLTAVIWLALGRKLVWLRYGLVVGIGVIHALSPGIEIPFVFYFFTLSYLAYHRQTGQTWALVGASTLAVITFYMKANVGLVSVASVIIYAGGQGLLQQMSIRSVGICLGSLALLLGLSTLLLPVQLVPYIVAQWHIIDSYNDLMSQPPNTFRRIFSYNLLIILALAGATVGLLVRLYKMRQLRSFLYQEGWLWVLVCLQLFVLFKESFVRADPGHICLFHKYALLPLVVLGLFSAQPLVRRWVVVPILLFLAVPTTAPYIRDATIPYRWAEQMLNYGRDIYYVRSPTFQPSVSPIPATWLKRIGNKRVDVIPSDVSLIHQYGLSYSPRPLMQTYQVTDGYLDSLNAATYRSQRASDYILMCWNAIDDRDSFTDEISTKLALVQHYDVVDQQGSWLLLMRKPRATSLRTSAVKTSLTALNQAIPVDTAAGLYQLWQINCRYKPMARVQRLLFQPPLLHIEYTYQTGERDTFRTSIPLLKAGILVPVHPRNLSTFAAFLRGNVKVLPRIRSARLLADPADFEATVTLRKQTLQLANLK